MRRLLSLSLALFMVHSTHGQENQDPADELARVQALLNDPGLQSAGNPEEIKATSEEAKFSGEMLEMGSKLVEQMTSEAQNDPEKAQKLINQVRENPTGFGMNAAEQEKLRSIASDLESMGQP